MPDLPYTDADLRAEAARQLTTAAADPDFMGIGERMEGADIASTVPAEGGTGRQWDALDSDEFDAAQRAIDGLLESAADLSTWAVEMGADNLEPDEGCLSLKGVGADGEQAIVRVHFAFAPTMPDGLRNALIEGVGQSIADVL